jgi:hypothetical protein
LHRRQNSKTNKIPLHKSMGQAFLDIFLEQH